MCMRINILYVIKYPCVYMYFCIQIYMHLTVFQTCIYIYSSGRSYEFTKRIVEDMLGMCNIRLRKDPMRRILTHMISSSCGNAISSLIFVPKELIKHRLQAQRMGLMSHRISSSTYNKNAGYLSVTTNTILQSGVKGLYAGSVSVYTRTCCTMIHGVRKGEY